MANLRDRTRQNVRGGGVLKLRQLYPSPSDTFVDVGILGGTDLADAHTMVEQKDERGLMIDVMSSGNVATLDTQLKQSGIDEINLINQSRGKYYEAYYPVKLNNGNTQELNVAICKIDPNLKMALKQGERNVPLKIYMLTPATAATRTPTGYNITTDPDGNPVPYVIAENAVALGAPSDAAATVWAAVK